MIPPLCKGRRGGVDWVHGFSTSPRPSLQRRGRKVDMKARVFSNEEIESGYFKLSLSTSSNIEALPGQFLMFRVSPSTDPLLCRPFGFHRILSKNRFEILYKIAGKGTNMMSRLAPDTEVLFFGPLGRGFDIPSRVEKAIIVAGGIGVAPMVYLAESIRRKLRDTGIDVFIGGKNKMDVLCVNEFEKIGAVIHITTEDGSLGEKGLITDLLQRYIGKKVDKKDTAQIPPAPLWKRGVWGDSVLYSCGPESMLKEIAGIAEQYNLPCQVSLEGVLACGVGACRGCAVKVKGQGSRVRSQKKQSTVHGSRFTEYKMVCKDGPVFDSREIEWE